MIRAALSLLLMASTTAVADVSPMPGSGYDNWGLNLIVVVVTLAVLSACVLLHYECLSVMSRRFARPGTHRRRRVLFGIFGVLLVHVIEIWIFGIAYFLLLLFPGFGEVHGVAIPSLLDHVYFSAITYTTVGYGDVFPIGAIRFLVGTEALTGFVMITWSASFTYLEMERFWRGRE